jgi:DNA-binding NtrC family response regulator
LDHRLRAPVGKEGEFSGRKLVMACILVVDDNEAICHLARLVLSKAGHEVIAASTAEEALTAAKQGTRIDLVLLDKVIPGPSWNITLSSLRDLMPGMACILSSGYQASNGSDSESSPAGLLFLQKPYRAADLLAIVSKALGTG